MKMITAIVRPDKITAIKDALTSEGIKGITVSDVQGFGQQKGQSEIFRGREYNVQFVNKAQIMVCVSDKDYDKVISVIMKHARTGEEGKIGDGKIFVYELHDVYRIRTGESGEDAI